MTYDELKKLLVEDKEISKKIYIGNFFGFKKSKKDITIIRNIFWKYTITYWLDQDYRRYIYSTVLNNRDDAANLAWKLYQETKKMNYIELKSYFSKLK